MRGTAAGWGAGGFSKGLGAELQCGELGPAGCGLLRSPLPSGGAQGGAGKPGKMSDAAQLPGGDRQRPAD